MLWLDARCLLPVRFPGQDWQGVTDVFMSRVNALPFRGSSSSITLRFPGFPKMLAQPV
jgi:hypothetical protein